MEPDVGLTSMLSADRRPTWWGDSDSASYARSIEIRSPRQGPLPPRYSAGLGMIAAEANRNRPQIDVDRDSLSRDHGGNNARTSQDTQPEYRSH